MSAEPISQQVRLAILALDHVWRSAIGNIKAARLFNWRHGGPPSHQLLLIPRDLGTADPSLAAEIKAGQFGLAGQVVELDPLSHSPFDIKPPNDAWERALYSFTWLGDLRAGQQDGVADYARRIVLQWMKRPINSHSLAWQPDIAARRLICLLCHSPLLVDGADQDFYADLMASLTRHIRFLARSIPRLREGQPKLVVLSAITMAALSLAEQRFRVEQFEDLLASELEAQILPDGGHISRRPGAVLELLLDLLPLRQCFVAREMKPPKALAEAISRMLPMIRFFRMGDATLARFNGMGATPLNNVATILSYEDIQSSPPVHAAFSGYCRLASGETILLADAGSPPPLTVSGQAHAGCSSFELSVGHQMLLVNCGAPAASEEEKLDSARATRAHNSLTLGQASCGRFLKRGLLNSISKTALLTGPTRVEARMETGDNAQTLRIEHDGYMKKYFVRHERLLRLFDGGERIEGEDLLLPALIGFSPVPYAIRFHVHPDVEATLSKDKRSVDLTLANGENWRFSHSGGALSIMKAEFFASRFDARDMTVLTLSGTAQAETILRWVFERKQASSSDGGEVAA